MEAAPVSATYGFACSLPAKLERLLKTERNHGLQLSQVEKKKIRLLKDKLQDLNSNYLLDPSKVEFPASAARCWVEEVRELSYDIDDFHDELHAVLQKNPRGSKLATLREGLHRSRWIMSEISRFRTRLEKAIQRYKTYNLHDNEKLEHSIISCSSNEGPVPLPRLYGLEAASPVGMGDYMGKIEKWLTEGEAQLRAVAVVGPGGVGKTTLAKEIYCKIGKQFECRAFVRSSQMPDVRKLLTSILFQVRPHRTPDFSESCNLASTIRAHLQQKKYFIIIDDLWALSTWDLIRQALPDDNNCYSRILTTTEVDALAFRCCGHNSEHIIRMELLSSDMPHELFSRFEDSKTELSEVTSDNSTTSFINKISSEIISKCGGFPLAIVSIASLLARQPKDKLEPWNYIWSYLSSNEMTKPTIQVMNHVLTLCYDSLPDHLKTCMLYLSLYKEDHIIWKDDLVKQWIAEGFICVKEEEDIEEVGSTYFDELVSKGIIQPVHNSHNGKVLSFTVHYIVLQFIQCKSIEQNFLIAINHSETNLRLADKVHRLSLHFGDAEHAKPPEQLSMLSQVRSLAFYGHFRSMPCLAEFRLLRVLILDLWGDQDNIKLDFAGVGMLRYLEIASNVTLELQTEWQCLQYLETLKIDSRTSEVPQDIVHLSSLLHLTLPGETNLPGVDCMASLRTFGCFDLSTNSTHNVESLGKLTNLRNLRLTCSTMLCENYDKNLGLVFSSLLSKLRNLKSLILLPAASSSNANAVGGSSLSNNIPLACSSPPELLEKLELSARICIFPRLPSWIGHLAKLSILKIASRELSQRDIDILKKLDALSALLLHVRIAPQERIVFHDGFPVLKHFKFICSRFCLMFEKGAMPQVRRLKLGFNTNGLDKYSPADAGFTNLKSLAVFYAKIGCAGGPETDRQDFQSALEDAFSSCETRPRINVHLVDSIFHGDKEMTTVAETEQPQTLEKADVVINEGPKGQYEIRDMGSSEDKDSRARRTSMASEPFSYIQNQGNDEKTPTHVEKFKTGEEQGAIVGDPDEKIKKQRNAGKDIRKQDDRRTSMASEPWSHLQSQGGTRWRPRNVYSPVEKALGIKYVSRQLAKLEALRVKNDIASIKLEMELMAIIIEENKENGPGALPEKWVMKLQHLVHDIEDFIDVYNWLRVRSWRHTHAHTSQIVHLKNRTKIVREWQQNAISSKNEVLPAAFGSSAGTTLDYAPQEGNFIGMDNLSDYAPQEGNFIGMDNLRHELLQLVKGHNYYDDVSQQPPMVISIVGPHGVGKTALARSIYADARYDRFYDVIAWVAASECSSEEDLLSNIRQQVQSESRCLVVIDGLQQPRVCNEIRNAITRAKRYSRIIVTTSYQSVAFACSPERYIYKMQVLSDEESRQLFLSTIGHHVFLTPAQEQALEVILRKCGGLPVALVSIANCFRGPGENLTYRMTSIGNSLAGAPGILEAMNTAFLESYNNLPDSVHRTCLLSLSIFPHGHLMKRKSLIRRWIAEGWVVGGSLSAEHIANVYFDDLIDRNIIDPVRTGINSKVKRVRVHDFLLEVIINKSVCKNFAALIRMDEPLHRSTCSVRRLSVHGGTAETTRIAKAIGLNHVRSLTICSGVPLDLWPCRLLRVLDMEGCDQIDDRVLGVICSLVLLKYLSLRHTDVCRIPDKIRNLCDLETLDIRETRVEILPMEVLMLPRLAHLFGRFLLPRELRVKKKRRKMQRFFEEESKLQAVSGFVMVEHNGYEPIVLHMRLLRKIKIWCQGIISTDTQHLLVSCLKDRWSGNNALESLSIDFGNSDMGEYFAYHTASSGPCRLSSIKLRGKLRRVPEFITRLAMNLSELQLSSTSLSLGELSLLQHLHLLLYLKLAEDSDEFWGGSLVVHGGGFPSLERLCFQAPNLPHVLIGEGAMSSVKSLHLLCLGIHDSWQWKVENLKNLNEVVLPASVNPEELKAWKRRASRHTNTPKVIVQL